MSKKYFESLGQQAKSLGRPLLWNRLARTNWPTWAREAWARGWICQGPSLRRGTEQ